MSDTDKLYPALAQAQAHYPKIGAEKRADVRSKTGASYSYAFADMAGIMEAVRGPNTEAGLIVIHRTDFEGDAYYTETQVIHVESGQLISSRLRIDPRLSEQDLGKALTYGQRYCTRGLLGICIDEDTDAAGIAPPVPDPEPEQDLSQPCKVGSFWASARNLLKAAGIEDAPSQDECVRRVMGEVGKEIMQSDTGFESTKEMTERDAAEVLRRIKLDVGAGP